MNRHVEFKSKMGKDVLGMLLACGVGGLFRGAWVARGVVFQAMMHPGPLDGT
jgi:hypothetical protein